MMISQALYIPAFIALIGAIGMVRFPGFFMRVHAATMISMGGTVLALLLLTLRGITLGFAPKILFVALLLLMTSPTASHAIANAAYRMGLRPFVVKNELEGKL